MLDKQVLVILTFCAWSSLGGIIHLDGLADDHSPVSTVVFTEFVKDAPDVRITNRIPFKIPVPHLVPVDRVKTVEIPQPRPYPVDSPYAVPVSQPVPYAVPQEVPVPVSKPFPWPVPQPVPFPVTGVGHQGLEESLRQSTPQHSVTTGILPSQVTSDIAGSYTPQHQTSTESETEESSQQTDGTATTASSQTETDSGNPSSESPYSPQTTAADVQYVSDFLPLLKTYLEIFQQPTGQTGEPLQSSYALQFPVQNESNATLENVSGAQSQSGFGDGAASLMFPTTGTGNYFGYGLQDHAAGLSFQSPGIPQQTVLFSSHVTPQTSDESSGNATDLQQQEADPESGQLQDHNGATTSGNYLFSSQFTYPQFPHGEANNLLTNTQLYPGVYGFPSSSPPQQSTVNQIPGTLDSAANSASSGNHVQQTESGTSADFQIQNSQTYENLRNYYLSQEKVNAQLISLQNLLYRQFAPAPVPTTVVRESLNQVPGQSQDPETVAVPGVESETTESPKTIVSSDSPPAPLSTAAHAPVSIQTSGPPPVVENVQERLEAASSSGRTLKDPVPLSEPPTTVTTKTTVTQGDEKLPLTTATTTAPPETTTTPVLITSVVTTAEPETVRTLVKTSPTPVVATTAEPQIIQISPQLQTKPTNFPDPQYRIISLPFVQPQLLTLPLQQQQHQRQQLQVVVTQV